MRHQILLFKKLDRALQEDVLCSRFVTTTAEELCSFVGLKPNPYKIALLLTLSDIDER